MNFPTGCPTDGVANEILEERIPFNASTISECTVYSIHEHVVLSTVAPITILQNCFFYCSGHVHVAARVQLDQITTEAYQHCFSAIFDTMKKDYPSFEVGKSLQELVVDWSDQHTKGQWVLT